jgi:hypothetical protein
MPMCSVHSCTLCRACLIETSTVVSCLSKCQSERMSISIRSLTVWEVLRTMEQRGLAELQIMLYFSWSVFCIESGSNQLLTTSAVEALRLTSWWGSWMRFLVHARMLDCKLLPLSDMGANNVTALILLGATICHPYFKFQNQETVTMYDPPHLLKCTRSLFLKYDV